MQPDLDTNITVVGDLGGSKTAMTIDENSLAHLISVLTDLYSDQQMAVIREYSTNALDAHIESGNKSPIEITLPSTLSPYFKVKDNGIGMSVSDLTDIYSKYGASTKRGTNEQVGMLGLGCKSALTYTQNFMIVAVKNGVKTSANISRIEDGTGMVEIVDTCATDEPNGVEIVVPVQRYNEFKDKSEQFFRFWEEGTVLINGKSPYDREGWMKITESVFLVQSMDYDYVVMGNVAYRTEKRIFNAGGGVGIVAYVPIGAINFTPSREALHYTKKTTAAIEAITAEVKENLKLSIENEVSACKNHSEAMTVYTKWHGMFRWNNRNILEDVKFRGLPIPMDWKHEFIDYVPQRYRNQAQRRGAIAFSEVSNGILIKGFDANNLTTTHRKKIKKYLEDIPDSRGKHVYLMDKTMGSPWTDDFKWYPWKDIKSLRLTPLNPRTYIKKEPGYDVFGTKHWDIIDDIPKDDEIIYWSPADHGINGIDIRYLFPDKTLVSLSKNRWPKFLRDHPNCTHARTAARPLSSDIGKGLTDDDKKFLANRASWVRDFDEEKIDDPALSAFITLLKAGESATLIKYRTETAVLNNLGLENPYLDIESYRADFARKYPMAHSVGYNLSSFKQNGHLYIYLNAVHNAKKEA